MEEICFPFNKQKAAMLAMYVAIVISRQEAKY